MRHSCRIDYGSPFHQGRAMVQSAVGVGSGTSGVGVQDSGVVGVADGLHDVTMGPLRMFSGGRMVALFMVGCSMRVVIGGLA